MAAAKKTVPYARDTKLHSSTVCKTQSVHFFKELSRMAIVKMEIEEPFKDLEMYDLNNVDIRPLDVSNIPPESWPYSNCLFDVLSEKNNASRFTRLKDFFLVLGQPGDPSESVGLMYTVMHLWKFFYGTAMVTPTPRMVATAAFFLRAGIFQCGVRILERCSDKQFLLTDFNRLVPYRYLELIFAATQAPYDLNDDIVNTVLAEPERAYEIFYSLICGELSCLEQVLACQLASNFSCYPKGVVWLLDHPKLVGKIGMHMWATYDIFYRCLTQYQELQVPYVKHLIFTDIEVIKDLSAYKPLPLSVADLCIFVILCCLCNVCAAHPEDEPMWRVEPCLLAVVREGLFTHMGTVIYGVILNDNRYYEDLNVEKFISFLSWSCFQPTTQRLAIEQLNSLPTHRNDFPLFYEKDSYSKSRSVIACLLTHACHFDYEKGSHFATLAIIYLLKECEDVAMELVQVAGDTLFDMSHSIYHAQMPSPMDKPVSLKRIVLETILKFSGSSFFSETGEFTQASTRRFKEPVPLCVSEARAFCELHVKQMTMKRYDKQRLVSCADEFKAEGNDYFARQDYLSAIECYTKAIETCPLSCIERRSTYHSNRAECYLKTKQSYRALRDCNKALAMNYNNLRTRWRRVQAFRNLQKRFPAALDLLTIRRHEEEAKQFLGEKLYADLDQMIYDLMDGGRYYNMASTKYGSQVHSGSMERNSLNMEQKENRLNLPPYRGKYFHEIFK